MKKLFLSVAAIALSAVLATAQDINSVTETYNNGAAALASGEKASALDYFKSALTAAEAVGADGAEIVGKCKDIIPQLMLSIAKEQIKGGSFDEAVSLLKETSETASAYGDAESAADAVKLIPTAFIQKGSQLQKVKDNAGAAEAFKAALDADPANGMAAIRLGTALNAMGDADAAIEAFETAAQNGQAATANKQITNILLKKASGFLKTKDFKGAIEAATKSLEFGESANAYKIIGTASNALGDKAAAVKNLSKYLELSPSAADAAQIKAAVEALSK